MRRTWPWRRRRTAVRTSSPGCPGPPRSAPTSTHSSRGRRPGASPRTRRCRSRRGERWGLPPTGNHAAGGPTTGSTPWRSASPGSRGLAAGHGHQRRGQAAALPARLRGVARLPRRPEDGRPQRPLPRGHRKRRRPLRGRPAQLVPLLGTGGGGEVAGLGDLLDHGGGVAAVPEAAGGAGGGVRGAEGLRRLTKEARTRRTAFRAAARVRGDHASSVAGTARNSGVLAPT